jgi:hypothetical protein
MSGEIILYQTEDGVTVIRLQAQDGSVWLTQAQLAELFQTSIPNINQHIKAILDEGEQPESTIKQYLIVQTEGSRTVERQVSHYDLPMIMAIGFRVRSPRGLQFRRWAAAALSEYLVKGFVMDDDKLKNPDSDFFEELLSRIRDIRSSEKLFYRKVLDIYATSVDYDPKAESSERFFQTVQNKMHYAAHGHTAAEVVHARADASKDHMGLSTWAAANRGGPPTRRDAVIAKNYLEGEELETLNRIVTAYLEFAELQALNRKPMHMADWVAKLDEFLKLGDRQVLTHAGQISHVQAKDKAEREFAFWQNRTLGEPTPVEQHFMEAVSKTKQIEGAHKRGKAGGKDAS